MCAAPLRFSKPPRPPVSVRSSTSPPPAFTGPIHGTAAARFSEDYRKHRHMNVITLRPRGFIPYWDRAVYTKYSDWARWFWKGAVHIDDVATAVILSLDLSSRQQLNQ